MGLKDLEKFLNSKEDAKEQVKNFDWEAEKQEWLNELENLYNMIENWLKPLEEKNKVKFEYKEISLIEENIGAYKAKELILHLLDQKVTLEPVGTLIIGAKGRINMIGAQGSIMILLVRKNATGPRVKITINGIGNETKVEEEQPKIEWAWKLATTPPKIQYHQLNEDSFSDALMAIVK